METEVEDKGGGDRGGGILRQVSSIHTAYPAVVLWDRNPLDKVGAGHRSTGPLEEPRGGGCVGVVGLDHIPVPR